MDMKRILQAMDGVAAKPVVGADSMAKFLSIVDKNASVQVLNEGNPHKVSLPVQMAMQHYQSVESAPIINRKTSLLNKYFQEVEQELAEQQAEHQTSRQQLIKQYSQTIAERVLMKEAANPAQQAAIAIAKKKEQQADESLKTNNPCWKGYHPVGTKKKNGKTVPNCVPKESVSENEIPGHSMGFTGGVGPGMGNYVVDEAPIEMDPTEPMNPTIYGHQGANPTKLKTRMLRAAGQLKDLATRAQTDSALGWESIARNFDELAMNIEQIRHGIQQLAELRAKGGINSRGIDRHIGESAVEPVKTVNAKIKAKKKTSTCRAGQTQTGMQTKDGKLVPKCSVTGIKK